MNILYEISQTAARFPDRTVMICKEGRLNYGDLARCTDLLAAAIQRLCKENRTPIPVYGHKSPLMLICFLACVKSGRGYCPIDVSVPWSRTMQIIKNIQPPFVLACEDPEETESADASVSFIKKDDILNLIEETDPAETEALTPVSGDDLFYMIFTSGSTGNPKRRTDHIRLSESLSGLVCGPWEHTG